LDYASLSMSWIWLRQPLPTAKHVIQVRQALVMQF
jgi:hypothetical protein